MKGITVGNQRATVMPECGSAERGCIHPPVGGCSPIDERDASQAHDLTGRFSGGTSTTDARAVTCPFSDCFDTPMGRCLLMTNAFHHDSFFM